MQMHTPSSSNQISPNVVDPDERSNFHPVHLSLFAGSELNYPDSHDLFTITLLVAFANIESILKRGPCFFFYFFMKMFGVEA